jgi:hypothetical protein
VTRVLLWLPRRLLSQLFAPVNRWFDTMAADVEFLVEQHRKAKFKK